MKKLLSLTLVAVMALGLLAFLAFFLFLKSWVKASAEYERLLSAIPEE